MPTFNGEKYIKVAIESILQQTYTNLELVIIDDGSNDSTALIINSFRDKRIKYHFQQHMGPAEAYNKGFSLASGEYIAIMDHDDISVVSRIQKLLEYSELNSLDLCGSWYQLIGADGEQIDVRNNPINDADIKKQLIYKNFTIFHPTILYKAEIFKSYGNYSSEYFPSYDYEYLLRIADYIKFGNIDENLYSWRINPTSVSSSNIKMVYNETKKISLNYLYKHKSNFEEKEYYYFLGLVYYYNNELIRAFFSFSASLLYGNRKIKNLRYLIFCGPLGLIIKLFRHYNIFYFLPMINFRKKIGV